MANRLILVLAAASLLGACSMYATQEEQDAYRAAHPEAARHAARAEDRRAASETATPAPTPAPVYTPPPAPPARVAAATPQPTAPTLPPVTTAAAPPLPDSSVAAANLNVPPPQAAARDTNNGEIIVPGQQRRQVTPPPGDPRSVMERMADIRAWDHCVMRAQGVNGDDPLRRITDTPEDICRQRLGMDNRTAVPDSRKPH